MNFLVFDLDGTISDPLEGISNAINAALSANGYETASLDQVRPHIGPPLDQAFIALTQTKSPERISKLIASYREYYGSIGLFENSLYPGIVDSLKAVKKDHPKLGICTSKRTDFARRILDHFDLLDLFEFVDGGDVGITKATQLRSLKDRGVLGVDSIMIGDRAVDMEAAKFSGFRCAGVRWGHAEPGELESCAPDFMFNHPRDLLQILSVV